MNKKTQARLKELNEAATKLGNEISDIEIAERKKKNAKHIGRLFKQRTNYSSPEKRSDFWTMYAVCTRMDEHGLLFVRSFSTDKYGSVTIEPDQCGYHMQYWKSCPRAEYKRALAKLKHKVAGLR
jgi:hypothetical protein